MAGGVVARVVGAPVSQRRHRLRPGLAVHQQTVAALEAAHRPPCAAVEQAVDADVQQPLQVADRVVVVSQPQYAVVDVDVVAAMVPTVVMVAVVVPPVADVASSVRVRVPRPQQRRHRARPHLAVHQQVVVALEAAHGPPGAAVEQAVDADLQQPLRPPDGVVSVPQPQDAVVCVPMMSRTPCALMLPLKQRAPRVRPHLAVGQQVVVPLEALDSAPRGGSEDAVGGQVQQLLQLPNQGPVVALAQDRTRHAATARG